MQSDNKKSNSKSHLQQSVFTKSLAGVLILGGLAIGANRENAIATIRQEQTVTRQSVQLPTTDSVTPAITLQPQVEQVRNGQLTGLGQLTGIEQSASLVLTVKR